MFSINIYICIATVYLLNVRVYTLQIFVVQPAYTIKVLYNNMYLRHSGVYLSALVFRLRKVFSFVYINPPSISILKRMYVYQLATVFGSNMSFEIL